MITTAMSESESAGPSRSLTLTDPCAPEPIPPLPHPWMLCTHPQGSIYFYNPDLKVVTDEDLRDPNIYQSVMQKCSVPPISKLGNGIEVHLHHIHVDTHVCFNLFINHALCLASFELDDVYTLDSDCRTIIRHRRRYWNFLQFHPAHVSAPKLALQDVVEALTWYHTDNLISGPDSIVPFSKSECEDLLRVLRDTTIYSYDNSVSRTVFLAWIMREVTSFRDATSYGQFTAKQLQARRASKFTSISASLYEHRPLVQVIVRWIINIFFFTIPWTYLAHVKASSEFRGRLNNVEQNWERYVERLAREYSDFLLISTVLLSATVGFLTVGDLGHVSKAIAMISAFAALGSIIVGVFSIWRHQTNTHRSAAFMYMHNAQRSPLGFEGHAILLSLPPVLLVWAILAFSAAIIAYALQSINHLNAIAGARAWVVLGVFVIILIFVGMGLRTFSSIWKFQSPSRFGLYGWKRGNSRQTV